MVCFWLTCMLRLETERLSDDSGWEKQSSLFVSLFVNITVTRLGKTKFAISESVTDTVTIDDFRGACAVKGNVQVAGRTSSVSTTEMLSTHDVTLRNVDGSLFHVQI